MKSARGKYCRAMFGDVAVSLLTETTRPTTVEAWMLWKWMKIKLWEFPTSWKSFHTWSLLRENHLSWHLHGLLQLHPKYLPTPPPRKRLHWTSSRWGLIPLSRNSSCRLCFLSNHYKQLKGLNNGKRLPFRLPRTSKLADSWALA